MISVFISYNHLIIIIESYLNSYNCSSSKPISSSVGPWWQWWGLICHPAAQRGTPPVSHWFGHKFNADGRRQRHSKFQRLHTSTCRGCAGVLRNCTRVETGRPPQRHVKTVTNKKWNRKPNAIKNASPRNLIARLAPQLQSRNFINYSCNFKCCCCHLVTEAGKMAIWIA